jgi:hypothetical protein
MSSWHSAVRARVLMGAIGPTAVGSQSKTRALQLASHHSAASGISTGTGSVIGGRKNADDGSRNADDQGENSALADLKAKAAKSAAQVASNSSGSASTPFNSAASAPSSPSSLTTLDRSAACGATANACYAPDGALGVGPNSILAAVNGSFSVYSRSGRSLLGPVSYTSFFGISSHPFDPRGFYDAGNASSTGLAGGSGRFVLLALASGSNPEMSSYLLAVSQNSSPQNGSTVWCKYRFDALTYVSGVSAKADYPGLGLDGNNIYITSNQTTFGNSTFQQARIMVIPKSTVYPNALTGTCPTAKSWDFQNLANPDGGPSFTVQPTEEPDALPGSSTSTMYFVNAAYPTGSQLAFRTLTTNSQGATLSAPSWVTVAPYDMPADAPQPQGSSIATGDTTLLGATYRYGRVYTANNTRTVGGNTNVNPYSSVQWYSFAPGASVATSNAVTSPNIAYYMPGIVPGCTTSVSPCPTPFVALEFSGSSAQQPASAFDLLVGSSSATLFRSGVPAYSYFSRWGDYPGLSIDPIDPTTVWVLGEYAAGVTDWGTAVNPIKG